MSRGTLSPRLAARAAAFAPDCLSDAEWQLAGPPLTLLAAACRPGDGEDLKGLLSRGCLFLSRQSGWDRSRVPDLRGLLTAGALADYDVLLAGLGYRPKTRENHRTDLRRLTRVVHGLPPRPPRGKRRQTASSERVLDPAQRAALVTAVGALEVWDPTAGRLLAGMVVLELGAGVHAEQAVRVVAGQLLFGPGGSVAVAIDGGWWPIHTDAIPFAVRALTGLPASAPVIGPGGRARVERGLRRLGLDPGSLLAGERLASSWLLMQLTGRPSLSALDAALTVGGTGLTRDLVDRQLPLLPAAEIGPTAAMLLAGTLPAADRRPPEPGWPYRSGSPAKQVSPRWTSSAPPDTSAVAGPDAARPVSRAAARRAARQALAAGSVPAVATPDTAAAVVLLAPAPGLAVRPVPVAGNSAEVVAAIDAYTATTLDPDVWARLAPLGRQLLHASSWSNRCRAVEAANHVAAFAAWAETRDGRPHPDLPLTVAELLLPGLLDTHIAEGLKAGGKDGTWATKRAVLGAVLRGVNPHAGLRIPRRVASAPYSRREAAAKKRLALHQPTAARRVGLCTTVGLGLGAGLVGTSLRGIRPIDITELVLPGGRLLLQVTTRLPDPRTVTIRTDCEPLIREALAAHAAAGRRRNQPLLGRPDRRNVASRAADDAVTADAISVDVDGPRLRNSWLVELMADRLPVALILSAAALRSARTLADLLPYVPLPDPATAAALLTGQPGELLPVPGDGRAA